MDIYDLILRLSAEVLALTNNTLAYFVDMPANATGPLDPAAGLTIPGVELVQHLASSGVVATQMLCQVMESLF
jgi:hypothetical protein